MRRARPGHPAPRTSRPARQSADQRAAGSRSPRSRRRSSSCCGPCRATRERPCRRAARRARRERSRSGRRRRAIRRPPRDPRSPPDGAGRPRWAAALLSTSRRGATSPATSAPLGIAPRSTSSPAPDLLSAPADQVDVALEVALRARTLDRVELLVGRSHPRDVERRDDVPVAAAHWSGSSSGPGPRVAGQAERAACGANDPVEARDPPPSRTPLSVVVDPCAT